MVLMASRSFSSPRSSIFCGLSATWNKARVARLTPASVACADSTTATRSVKGLRCSSSPLGSGLALRKRSNASRTSASVQGFGFFAAAALGCGLTTLALPDFAAGLVFLVLVLDFDLAAARRVIFGMFTSVPVLTFVRHRGTFVYECQNQRDTSKL